MPVDENEDLPTDTDADGEAGQEPAETPPEAEPEGDVDIDALMNQLDAEKRQCEQLRDEALRARAEADNTRRRAERDVENAHKYGLDKLIQQFLPVKDSMEMGLDASTEAEDVAPVREGLELTLKMFTDALEKLGVQAVDPAGEKFDPELHQAMNTVPSAEHEAGTVVMVMQKGYVLNERLIRPALVSVAKAPQ